MRFLKMQIQEQTLKAFTFTEVLVIILVSDLFDWMFY